MIDTRSDEEREENFIPCKSNQPHRFGVWMRLVGATCRDFRRQCDCCKVWQVGKGTPWGRNIQPSKFQWRT
jgi:hypothetical protein